MTPLWVEARGWYAVSYRTSTTCATVESVFILQAPCAETARIVATKALEKSHLPNLRVTGTHPVAYGMVPGLEQ